MSDEEGDVYLNPEDIVRVIELDDEGNAVVNGVTNGNDNNNGNVEGEGSEGEFDEENENAMDTGEGGATASVVPTQDDSMLTFSGHQNEAVICCQLHPLSNDIAVTGGQDDKALVWNPKTGASIFECSGHSDTVIAVGFSADGTLVASGDMKGLVQVWAVPSGALAWYFEVGDIEWLQWHQVAPVLLAGTKDGEVWMWKVPSGDCKTFPSHGSGASCGRLLPDGKHCCVGYEDGSIKVWDLKESEASLTLSGHEGHKSSVLCMDVKDNVVATGSEDGTAKIINVTTGKVTSTLQCGIVGQGDEETDTVEAIGLSAVNDYVATGTLSGKLEVWDLASKTIRHRFEHPYGIVKIQWSPTSPLFYTCGLDGCARQFDSHSGQLLKTWQGHTNGILDLSLAKSESCLLTASDDFTAKVFSLGNST